MVGPCHGRQLPHRPLLDRYLLRLTDKVPSPWNQRLEYDHWLYLYRRRLLAGDQVALTISSF